MIRSHDGTVLRASNAPHSLRDPKIRVEHFGQITDTVLIPVTEYFFRNHPMRNSRFTPIAVSLSLIVAMALQPIAVCWASRECSSGCSAVANIATETCDCCCAPRVNPEAPKATGSCCGVDEAAAESLVPEVRRVCLCDQNPQPIGDSSPSRITGKFSVSFSMLPIDSGASGLGSRSQLMTAQSVDRLHGRSHPSQADLSVWRL